MIRKASTSYAICSHSTLVIGSRVSGTEWKIKAAGDWWPVARDTKKLLFFRTHHSTIFTHHSVSSPRHSALVLLPGHSLAYLGFFASDQLAADIHGHAVNRSNSVLPNA